MMYYFIVEKDVYVCFEIEFFGVERLQLDPHHVKAYAHLMHFVIGGEVKKRENVEVFKRK